MSGAFMTVLGETRSGEAMRRDGGLIMWFCCFGCSSDFDVRSSAMEGIRPR
jgi:hypothetical protein